MLADPHFNRFRYLFAKNFATGEYAGEGVIDNEDDQFALALPDASPPVPHIEEEVIEFPFVSDENTARRVVARRAAFLALGSYRVSFSVPMPRAYPHLELSSQVGVTSIWGPGVNGFVNEEIKVTDIRHDYGDRRTDVEGILRSPFTVLPVAAPAEEGDFTALVPIELLFTWLFSDDFDVTWTSTGVYIDPADYDGVTECYFECVLANAFDNVVGVQVALVDENGTEYERVTTTTAEGYERCRSDAWQLDTVPHLYMLKTFGPGAGFDRYVDLTEARILIKQVNATKTKIFIPLLTGDGSTGGFAGSEAADDKALWCAFAGTTSYGPVCTGTGITPIPAWHNKIKIEKSKFGPVVQHGFQINANTNYLNTSSVGNSYAALFNTTTGLQISGTEIEYTQDQPPENKRIDFSASATNFTEGDELELRVKAAVFDWRNQLWIQSAFWTVKVSDA